MSSFFARNLKRSYPTIASARGSWLHNSAGQRYLDGCSGAVSANLGHCLPEINEAIEKQLRMVAFAHTSQFLSEPGLELAERLLDLAPKSFKGGKVYFSCGGSEAVETAMKLARSYWFEQNKSTQRKFFISRKNSYHGSTFGALSITGHPARRIPYEDLLLDHPKIGPSYPFRQPELSGEECANELAQCIERVGPENVIAFIAEPVVGAALGAVTPHEGYWKRIRDICDQYNILLIADEVMTGLGRCGTNFALDRWQVAPDIIVVGKGVAAGYIPLSAVIASPRVVAPFLAEKSSGAFEHGFTYSGHPLACAAGLAVAQYMQKHNIVKTVAVREEKFFARLNQVRKYEFVGDVRGCGFLAGIELVANRQTKEPFASSAKVHRVVADAALDAGLLVYPGAAFLPDGRGDHIMVAPPLNISEEDLDILFDSLDQVFATSEAQLLTRI